MRLDRRHALHLAPAALAAALAPPARAAFPDRPVTMVVPYAPGGSADVLARLLGAAMERGLGQPVIVELRPGAGGNIGAAHVAQQNDADGHTILFASLSLATSVSLSTIAFDPRTDLVPVAGVGAIPSLMVVAPTSPFPDLKALLDAARAEPGRFTFGSSGLATGSHLAGELLAARAGVEFVHVPYRGSGAVYPDLISGRIDFLLDVMGSSAGQVQEGVVRALAVTAAARAPAFPDVPTVAEAAVPGFEFTTWFGFFARSGTPAPALQRLEGAALAAVADGRVQERLQQAAAVPVPGPGPAFGRYFMADVERWAELVRTGRLQKTG